MTSTEYETRSRGQKHTAYFIDENYFDLCHLDIDQCDTNDIINSYSQIYSNQYHPAFQF